LATVGDPQTALRDPAARDEAAEILRGLVERIVVRSCAQGHIVELTGDIVQLLALPGGSVPDSFLKSLVAGARFDRQLKC
jgi:hypothetical protein